MQLGPIQFCPSKLVFGDIKRGCVIVTTHPVRGEELEHRLDHEGVRYRWTDELGTPIHEESLGPIRI